MNPTLRLLLGAAAATLLVLVLWSAREYLVAGLVLAGGLWLWNLLTGPGRR